MSEAFLLVGSVLPYSACRVHSSALYPILFPIRLCEFLEAIHAAKLSVISLAIDVSYL